jgi:hypothetical protein
MIIRRLLLIALCLSITGCTTGKPSGPSTSAEPSAYSGPTVDLSTRVARNLDNSFRLEISDYLKEIQSDGDYANWQVPPYTAYQQE